MMTQWMRALAVYPGGPEFHFPHRQNSPGAFVCICNSSVMLSGVTEMAEACSLAA